MTPQTQPNPSLPAKDTDPAIIVFGHDDSGKPHASTFTIDQRHDAVKAASLMGFRALAVEGASLIELAGLIPAGKVFNSGKGFVPFVKREVGAQLDEFAKDHPDLLITLPAPVASADDTETDDDASERGDVTPLTALPKGWDDIKVGSRVLAFDDPDDGWWDAIVQHVHESGTKGHPCPMYTLLWDAFPDDGRFTRRFDRVALLHPAFVGAEADGSDDTNEGA